VAADSAPADDAAGAALPDLGTREGTSAVLKWVLVLTVLAVAPAVAILVTSFTRIVVVLGLLRQGLGSPQLPPNQVLFGLSLLMTLVVMAPVLEPAYERGLRPYLAGEMPAAKALSAGAEPVRQFMVEQIDAAGNSADVYVFLDEERAGDAELTWDEVPTLSLVPAFVLSELKVAFVIGFRVFLPLVIVDLLVASLLVSMGMFMVPPVLISLPFKLLLFVLADGWHLVVETLMGSFR